MHIRTLATGLALTLGAGLGLAPTAGAAETEQPSAAAAEQALEVASEIVADAAAPVATGRDASMALLDLWQSRDALDRSDRAAADRLLSRPTSPTDEDYYGPGVTPQSDCGEHVCVHWAETGDEASTAEYAASVLETMDAVHERYVAAGYKPTLPDDGQGGTTQPDIYLAQIGDKNLYGYCTTDAPGYVDGTAVYAYCVLDNDYAADEFPTNTPFQNMQVTAAHEYFHAVQYAYDADDDGWIYETTATWAEDEVFDAVNDNWFYLAFGQLGNPRRSNYELAGPTTPLDVYDFAAYGNWVFFRFLTESFTDAEGGMPTLVRDVWEALDTTGPDGSELYSAQAVRSVLEERGTSLHEQYAAFAVESNTPGRTYDEGADYPRPWRALGKHQLTRAAKKVEERIRLDHLTSATGAYLPFRGGYDLVARFDLSKRAAGVAAAVAVFGTDGSVDRRWVDLAEDGTGKVRVPFGVNQVKRVEVTLVNTSSAMKRCGSDPEMWFSCSGVAKHDDRRQLLTVKAKKR